MKSLSDIRKWLKNKNVENYTVSEDLYITVHGNVDLDGKVNERELPVKFEVVDGYFNIANNNLETLEGCPKKVARDFNCSNNKITSLFGGPQIVGDFDCSNNELKNNLSYGPKEVYGYYNCSNNRLSTIDGAPRSIVEYFNCSNNLLTSLKGGPKYVDGFFDCSQNRLETLKGGPITVGQDYICYWNQLKNLSDVADEISWNLITDISLNHITKSFDEEKKVWTYKGEEVIGHIYKPLLDLTDKDDIRRWLSKHGVKDFHILKDNSVKVQGDVSFSKKLENLSKLPLRFHEVTGDFDISDNVLTTLEGSPKRVGGSFLAYKNELTSLKGGPIEVGKNFIILRNNITSLEYSPVKVKEDYICSHNPLKSLVGVVDVGGNIFTNLLIEGLKYQEFTYNSVKTYKYDGDAILKYIEKECKVLTEEEQVFEMTRRNIQNAINKMINNDTLKKEMINDTLLKNLTKYNLHDLKEMVLIIKNPPKEREKKELSEEEILQSVFDQEI
ncbi:hypothetical protein [Halarcobacter sp.]|uniref:hypothetical protein n=1 Tax=Halarcobacter sp. TaxID=2321133 RepID=UPI0029F4D8F3|nr:hypothetical protein [Halarcobacter sp.]